MASMNGGTINYGIKFTADQSGLNKVKQSLQELRNLSAEDLFKLGNTKDLSKAYSDLKNIKDEAEQIETALKKSFNQKLGVYNIEEFKKNLKGLDISSIGKDFEKAGAVGKKAFRDIASELSKTNLQAKKTSETLDKMKITLMNTIRWSISSSALNAFSGAIQEAYGYVKNLDKSLNNIQIVTQKNADTMADFAKQANKSAQVLGKSTTDYTNASLIYYQQGLSDKEVQARTNTTLKAANVTGQSTSEVADELTAVWNGYKVSAEETELYVDKLSKVAANTASDLEELSTGMSKVASAANSMGVDIDQLNAMLSTTISVTRQAPESVGTAYKTIFARMGDLALGKTDEDGVSLGTVSGQLDTLGVKVLDENNNMKDMGNIVEEVGEKWQGWTRAQQQAAAVALAGTRQYNNLFSLFDNWDSYKAAKSTSQNAEGELQKQQDTYMESVQAHLEQMSAAWEGVYDSILDPDSIKTFADAMKNVANFTENFVDSIGGGIPLLQMLGSIGLKVFRNQIGQGIVKVIDNIKISKQNAEQLKKTSAETSATISKMSEQSRDEVTKTTTSLREQAQSYLSLGIISQETMDKINQQLDELSEAAAVEDFTKEAREGVIKYLDLLGKLSEEEKKVLQESNSIDENKTRLIDNAANNAISGKQITSELLKSLNKTDSLVDNKAYLKSQDKLDQANKRTNNINDFMGLLDKAALKRTKSVKRKLTNNSEFQALIENMAEEKQEELNKAFNDAIQEFISTAKKTTQKNDPKLKEIKQKIKDIYEQAYTLSTGISTEDLQKQGERGSQKPVTTFLDKRNVFTSIQKLQQGAVATEFAQRGFFEGQKDNNSGIITRIPSEEKLQNQLSSKRKELNKNNKKNNNDIKQIKEEIASLEKLVALKEEAFGEDEVNISQAFGMKPNVIKEFEEALEKIQDIREQLSNASEEDQKNLGKELDKNIEKLDKIMTEQVEEGKKAQKNVVDSDNGAVDDARVQVKDKQKDLDRTFEDISLTKMTSQLTNFVSGVNSGLFALSSFKNAFYDIWEDKNTSTIEKMTQSVMAFTTATSMSISAIASLKDGVSGIKDMFSLFNAKILESVVQRKIENGEITEGILNRLVEAGAIEAGTAATEINTGAVVANGEALEIMGIQGATAWAEVLGPIALVIAALAALGVGIYAIVKAYNADAEAAEEAEEAAQEASDAAEEAASNYEKIKSAAENYDSAIQKMEDLSSATGDAAKNAKDYKEALEAANSAAMDIAAADPDMMNRMDRDINGRIIFRNDDGSEMTSEEIEAKAKSRAGQAKTAANMSQTEAYAARDKSNRTDIIRSGNLYTYEDIYADYDPSGRSAPTKKVEVSDDQIEKLISSLIQNENVDLNGDLSTLVDKNNKDFKNAWQQAVDAMGIDSDDLKYVVENASEDIKLSILEQTKLEKQHIQIDEEFYKEAAKTGFAQKNSDFADMTEGQKDMIVELANVANDTNQEEVQKKAEEKWKKDSGESDDDYDTRLQKAYADARGWTWTGNGNGDGEFLNAEGKEEEVDDDKIKTWLIQNSKQDAVTEVNQDNLKKYTDEFKEVGKALSKKGYSTVEEQAQLEALMHNDTKDKFDSSRINLAEFKKLSKDIQKGTLEDIIGATGVANLKTQLDNIDINTQIDLARQSVGDIKKNAESLSDKLESKKFSSEKEYTDDDDYKALKDQIDNLKELRPDLIGAIETFKDTALYDTQNYADAVEQITEAIQEEKTTKSRTDLEDSFENIDLTASIDTSQADEKIKSFIDKDYEVTINVKTASDEAFEELEQGINALQDGASKIGEDFTVSADDIKELNEQFPGIISGMTLLNDGSVQLNKQSVQEAVAAAQQTAIADTKATQTKLENTKRELLAKRAVYAQMAKAAHKLATTENLSEEQKSKYQTSIKQGLAKVNTVAAKDETEANKTVTDNANDNAKQVAKNWTSAYQSASDSAEAFAKNAITAAKAAANNDVSELDNIQDIKVNYTGGNGTSTEVKQNQNYAKELANGNTSQKAMAEQEKYYNQMITFLDKQLASVDGQMAEGAAKLKTLMAGFKNVKNGKGFNTSATAGIDTDTIDKYHDINLELKELETNLSRVEKAQEKLVRQDLMDNLNKQLGILNQQADAQERKLAIAKQDMAFQQSQLASLGVTFGANGAISNYASVLESAKHSGDSQRYSTLQTLISNYDTLYSETIPGIIDDIQEIADKKVEIQISKFKMNAEIALDLRQAKQDWAEFLENMTEDIDKRFNVKIQTQYKKANAYISSGELQTNADTLNTIIREANIIKNGGTSSIYGKDLKQAEEDLKDYQSKVEEGLTTMKESLEEARQIAVDAAEAVNSAMNDYGDQLERINNLYEHHKKVIELAYGEKAYNKLSKSYAAQEKNNQQQLSFWSKQADYWEKQIAHTKKGTDAWKQAVESWQNAVDKMNTSIENTLQSMLDNYSNTVKQAFQEVENELTNGLGIDYLKDQMDLKSATSDLYLDDINSEYEKQKLQRKYQDAIYDADSVAAQQKISKAMQEQIDMLEKKDKLSQYDIDRANKKYELTLKQIALEEAQNNKTTMRLRRDANGNYSYQYVANQDQVSKAQQELADTQNDLYNFDKDAYQKNLDGLVQMWKDYRDKEEEIRQDSSLSEEKRKELLLDLEKQYCQQSEAYTEQNQTIRVNLTSSATDALKNLYEKNTNNFAKEVRKEKAILLEDLVPNWNSGVQQMADQIGEKGFQGVVQTAVAKSNEALTNLNKKINSVLNTYESRQKGMIRKNRTLSKQYLTLLNRQKSIKTQTDNTLTSLENQYKKWRKIRSEALAAAKNAERYVEAAKFAIDNGASGGTGINNKGSFGISGNGSNQTSGSTNSMSTIDLTQIKSKKSPKKVNEKLSLKDTIKQKYESFKLGGKLISTKGGPSFTLVSISPNGKGKVKWQHYIGSGRSKTETFSASKAELQKYFRISRIGYNQVYKNGVFTYNQDSSWNDLFKFDTGGYTGDWKSKQGKLAVLHEKELVLNKEDTKNMLNIVNEVREITAQKAFNLTNELSTLIEKVINERSNSVQGITTSQDNQSIEQKVSIQASFPGVKQAYEIEKALNNLVNIASQKAYTN